jgi:hypothetical protein
MIPDYMEPIGLHRDVSPLADFMAMASMRTDAEIGSDKLRKALLRAHLRNTPPPPRAVISPTAPLRSVDLRRHRSAA